MVDKILYKTLKKTFDIKENERVLIVTDTILEKIAEKFRQAAAMLTKNVNMITIEPTGAPGKEPKKEVAEEMKKYDVLLLITEFSLSHTDARRNAKKCGARIASLPGFTEEMIPALDIDYEKMKKEIEKIFYLVGKKRNFTVSSPSGTDLTFRARKCMDDTGILTEKGAFANLPAGEFTIHPVNMNGLLVIDSFKDVVTEPLKAVIKNSRLQDLEGKDADDFLKLLIDNSAKNIAEFGIGTNPKAKITGKTLMDEKVIGTCHIAFGNDLSFGGTNKSSVHLDTLVFKPTIYANDTLIMKNGVKKW